MFHNTSKKKKKAYNMHIIAIYSKMIYILYPLYTQHKSEIFVDR